MQSFVSTQKQSVQRSMARKFTHFISAPGDNFELVLTVLRGLLRDQARAVQAGILAASAETESISSRCGTAQRPATCVLFRCVCKLQQGISRSSCAGPWQHRMSDGDADACAVSKLDAGAAAAAERQLATYFLTLYTFLVRRTLEERLRQQYAVTDLTGFYESAAFRTSGFKLEAADILAERRITYAE